MIKCEDYQKKKKTDLIAFILILLSIIFGYFAIAQRKYPLQVFCFYPESVSSAKFRKKLCRDADNILIAHPKFLNAKDNGLPLNLNINLIPKKARKDLHIIPPSNPNFLIFAFFSFISSASGLWLYQSSIQRFKLEYPLILQKIKNQYLNESFQEDSQYYLNQMQMDLILENKFAEFEIQKHLNKSEEEILELQEDLKLKKDISNMQKLNEYLDMKKIIQEKNIEILKLEKEEKKLKSNMNDKSNFISDLKSHEGGWIYKLLNNRMPIWIFGGMGSGKSSLASAIALSRYILFKADLIQLIDPHGHINKSDAWKSLLSIFKDLKIEGMENNIPEIKISLQKSLDRWNKKMGESEKATQMIIDEYTALADYKELKDILSIFTKRSLTDPRKAQEYLILLSHLSTNTGTGNLIGSSSARNTQSIQIFRKSLDGERPLKNIFIKNLPDKDGNIEGFEASIPDWFFADKLISLIE